MRYLKLKENIKFKDLEKYGFIADPVNCESPDDTYYSWNNYFIQIDNNFRITINMLNRAIDILCLTNESGLHGISDLIPLYSIIKDNLIEVVGRQED